MSKTRKIIGWSLSGLLSAFLLFSALGKFTNPDVQAMMSNWGIGDWITLIAIGEVVSALLFLFPKTSIFGGLLLSSYFGGAIMIHLSHGEPFLLQSIILVVIWVILFVRNPHLLKG